jgi:hypothetical protein
MTGKTFTGFDAVYVDEGLPKPCVHPLTTPRGTILTGFEMSDHVWHRGLWFTIKFINGTNYWEENAPFGVQETTRFALPTGYSNGDESVEHELVWRAEATGDVFAEQRSIRFRRREDEARWLEWESVLVARQDLALHRTPYTTWGGYSGLTFRGSRELHQVSYELPSGEVVPSIIGDPHPWAVLRATVDGGKNRRVSLGIIDHPQNPRSPTSWYARSDPGYAFFNAAFLFHGPMSVRAGETLRFRYAVAYRDGEWKAGEFARLATAYRAT